MPLTTGWRWLVATMILGGMAGLFLAGFLVHRNRLPPYGFLSTTYRQVLLRYAFSQRRNTKAGVWDVARQPLLGSSEEERRLQLAALPYIQGYGPGSGRRGVITYDENRAFKGYTLVLSAHGPEAQVIDMNGTEVHSWRKHLVDVWPDYKESLSDLEFDRVPGVSYWRSVSLLPDGGLVAMFDEIGIIRIDRESRLLWAQRCRCHHDLDVDRDGSIYTLTHEVRPEAGERLLTDAVVQFSSEGKELRRFSLTDAFQRSDYTAVVERSRDYTRANGTADLFHTNSIRVYSDTGASGPVSRALISVPTADTVAVVDLETEVVTWSLSNLWSFQHDARWLDNGHLLVFDNRRIQTPPASRVIEIDPHTQQIVWKYGPHALQSFYTGIAGGSQRLENGNTLITESANGRVFEVTVDGTIAWDYRNPYRAGAQGELVATIYEATRLPQGAMFSR